MQASLVSSRSTSGVFLDGTQQINTLMSWHVKESAGAAAIINIRRASATGTILIPLFLLGNESVGSEFSFPPIANGWHLEIISGTVVVSISGM